MENKSEEPTPLKLGDWVVSHTGAALLGRYVKKNALQDEIHTYTVLMNAISLFSGAGGMDVGFRNAGYEILWANDFDKDACETYRKNIGNHIHHGSIDDLKKDLTANFENVDVVIGGPPCQGFSVAGKMDLNDPRSRHVWNFLDVVQEVKPKAFVMENVKALGTLSKWEPLRKLLLEKFRNLGYMTNFMVLNSSDYNVPQSRERVFFVGIEGNPKLIPDLTTMMKDYESASQTVRSALSVLDKAGTGNNSNTCKAKITFTANPVMRKSPYAGMLFNGLGRPIKIDGFCATLPASMGGNKTPIVDEEALYNEKENWVEDYHQSLKDGRKAAYKEAPKRLRRLTPKEASLIQTFPIDYEFQGSQSSIYKQIGNAVPCNLAYAVAKMTKEVLSSSDIEQMISNLLEFKLVS